MKDTIQQPTHNGYSVGNSPASNAVGIGNATSASQASLSKAVGGKKKKARYTGGGTTVGIVPGSNNQTTGVQTQMAGHQAAQAENSKWDSHATSSQKGAGYKTKKHKKGGMKWGCYSGGKKTKRKNKKSRKSRKSRK
jgi:hypothetical protein